MRKIQIWMFQKISRFSTFGTPHTSTNEKNAIFLNLCFDESSDEGEYVEEASLSDVLWANGSHPHLLWLLVMIIKGHYIQIWTV